MLELRLIPKEFDGTAALLKMYTGSVENDLLQPLVKETIIPKVIPEEDLQLFEYLISGKEPTLISLSSF